MAVDLVPTRRSIPEELAEEMRRAADLVGARILFPRARSGREALPEGLRASGAEVDIVEAYRTVRPEGAEGQLRVAMEAGLDAVTLMSPSAVSHLADLLGPDGFRKLAERAVLACIGPTTADAVRDHGVEPPLVCETPTAEALVEALELHFGRRNHVVSS
jgi:uroporphyrinogen III methyltransferase/synthase